MRGHRRAMLHLLASALLAFAPVGSLELLRQVDAEVDRRVTYRPDPEPYDVWRIAQWNGDCEDYALAKRELLIRKGWDPKDLEILFILMPEGGHVVLYVPSLDAVLDNVDEDAAPKGKTHNLVPYLKGHGASIICTVKDLSLGSKRAGSRC